MDITSPIYLLFVGISMLIYWFTPKKYQWLILLADSLIFYFACAQWYTFVYVIVSVFSVWFASCDFEKNPGRKKTVFILTMILNIGILAVLKYTDMAINTYNAFVPDASKAELLRLTAPLAISYYTLQIAGYLTDCCWGSVKPEKNPLKLMLFTAYFPLMVSGPISRYSDLSAQLFEEHRFDYDRVTSGLRRTAWGLAKKIIVADRIALFVDPIFADSETFSGLWVLVGACLFILQLYFDFSGCMDIITGVSSCFGIKLTDNFRAPFFSKTVQEFWQRWHITLGGWMKDYVMYPLLRSKPLKKLMKKVKKSGKTAKKLPSFIAMLVVWLLIGIWHGSSWKYVLCEGGFFYIVIVLGQLFEPVSAAINKKLKLTDSNKLWQLFRMLRTFILTAVGLIVFKTGDLLNTFGTYASIFSHTALKQPLSMIYAQAHEVWPGFSGKILLVFFIAVFVLQTVSDIRTYSEKDTQSLVTKRSLPVRWTLYLLLILMILLSQGSVKSDFIYFQF